MKNPCNSNYINNNVSRKLNETIIINTTSIKIDKETLAKTNHCAKNFECLKNENHFCKIRKVLSCINSKVIFVNCTEVCHYKMSFGFNSICNCPTRKEIFNKYKK